MMPQRNQPGARRSDEQTEWLTLGRAAEYLGVAQSTIRKWCDAGTVPAFTTPGGHRRFRKRDLDAFLERSRPGAPSPRNGPVILIVDNEPGVGAYVRASLEPEGYLVEEAAEADEALRLIEARSPDLIMIDAGMPQASGWETLSRLRELHGEGMPPVLLFSSLDDADEELARSRGASAFFGRPLDPLRLVERARQVLAL
jgi:excisionase family DNA binding protein